MQINIHVEDISMTLVAEDGRKYFFTASKGAGDFEVREVPPEFDPMTETDKERYMMVPPKYVLETEIELFRGDNGLVFELSPEVPGP